MQNSQRDDILEMVDEMLDMDGPVMIGSLEFSKSEILKRLDPIAYREACLDYINSHIEDLQYDLERSDDEEEIVWLKEQIEDLEDF
jgi:replicative DNA helicase